MTSPLADARVDSYKDFRRVVRGQSAQSLHGLYDRPYFERQVASKEFAALYFESGGLAPTEHTRPPLELAAPAPGDHVLDVGCGRGEIVFQSAARGAEAIGIDFAASAIDIANETLERHGPEMRDRITFLEGNAAAMPFEDGSFNKILMLDVVEHLARHELRAVLRELRRVIDDEGTLVIHTTENRWNNTLGHWLRTAIDTLRGRPRRPPPAFVEFERVRADEELDERKYFMHVNEQSLLSLKLALARAGFRSQVWIGESGDGWSDRPGLANRVKHLIYRFGHLEALYGNRIFAVARPRRRKL